MRGKSIQWAVAAGLSACGADSLQGRNPFEEGDVSTEHAVCELSERAVWHDPTIDEVCLGARAQMDECSHLREIGLEMGPDCNFPQLVKEALEETDYLLAEIREGTQKVVGVLDEVTRSQQASLRTVDRIDIIMDHLKKKAANVSIGE